MKTKKIHSWKNNIILQDISVNMFTPHKNESPLLWMKFCVDLYFLVSLSISEQGSKQLSYFCLFL